MPNPVYSYTVDMLHSHTWICETYVHNAHRNPETQKHLRLLSSGTKLFITFELKGFSTWGREMHNLSMLTFPSAPHHSRNYSSDLGEPQKSTVFFRRSNSTLTFLKSQPTLPVCDVTHIPGLIPIWDFYFDISEWHILFARSWTPALMLHVTNAMLRS